MSDFVDISQFHVSRRTGNTGRNDDDVGILHSGLSAVVLGQVAGNLL
jgi:hypothetical protein